MSAEDLQGLYQQLILDHAKRPHGRSPIDAATGRSHQVNPTCGDEVTLSVRVRDGVIEALGWEGHGCSISQASASLLATLMESTSVEDAGELLGEFRIAMRSRGETELDEDRFGDAIALNGVSRYVARVKCAMLPWVALEHALMGN
jgi:nitrogen fixation NifU-like protein